MPRPLRIAVVQFCSIDPGSHENNHSLNLRRAEKFVRDAAEKKANLVVFPEYFISGVVADPDHHHLAQHPHDYEGNAESSTTSSSWVSIFTDLAKSCNIDILCGTIVERATDSQGLDVLRNVSHYISRHGGDILARYEKRNLWHPEKDYLSPGEASHQVFDTEWGRVGILVCWDIAFPETFRELFLQKAEIILCPAYWCASDTPFHDTREDGKTYSRYPDSEATFLDNLVVTRAFENDACVVFVNTGGDDEMEFCGRSAVAMPLQGLVARAASGREELLVVDVDLDVLNDARTAYGIRKDLISQLRKAGTLPSYTVL